MLVFNELKKLLKTKGFILYFFSFIIINLFIFWIYTQSDTTKSAYREFENDIKDMNTKEIEIFLDEKIESFYFLWQSENINILDFETLNGYENNIEYIQNLTFAHTDLILNNEDNFINPLEENSYILYTDNLESELLFLYEIYTDFSIVSSYDDFLDNISEQTQKLSSISIFQNKDSFEYKNTMSINEKYKNLENIDVSYQISKPLFILTEFFISDIIIILFSIYTAFILIQSEKDSGMMKIILNTKNGRFKTAFSKISALFITTLVISVLIYVSIIIFSIITYGNIDLSVSIQSISFFNQSVLKINIFTYLFLFIFFKFISIFLISIFSLFCMIISKNILKASILILSIPFISLLIRNYIQHTNKYNFFRYFNPISGIYVNDYLNNYVNLNYFDNPVSVINIVFISIIFFFFLFLIIYLISFIKSNFNFNNDNLPFISFFSKSKGTTILKTEIYKLLINNYGLIIISALILSISYITFNSNVYLNYNDATYKIYLEPFVGEYTSEKYNAITDEFNNLSELANINNSNTPSSSINYDYYTDYNIYFKIHTLAEYVKSTDGASFIYDTGYKDFFNIPHTNTEKNYSLSILITSSIILLFSKYFTMEKNSGVYRLLYSSPLGKDITVKTKLYISLFICFIIASVSVLIPFIKMSIDFGTSGIFFAAKSIPEFYFLPSFIDILGLFILLFLSRFITSVFISFIIFAISLKSNKTQTVFILSSLLFLFPLIISFIGIFNIDLITVYPFINLISFFSKGKIYSFIYTISLITLIYLIFKLYNKIIDDYCWNFTDK